MRPAEHRGGAGTGWGTLAILDVRALLHRRLRFLATLLFGVITAVLIVFAVTMLGARQKTLTGDSWPHFVVTLAVLAPAGLLAGVLWMHPSLSFGQLRVLIDPLRIKAHRLVAV